MNFLFFYIILVSTSLLGNSFITDIGRCTIVIYDGEIDEILDIKKLIINESKKLTYEFGKVNKKPFSVYITSNMEEFYEKSEGPVPEWGIAIAKNKPDKIIIKAPGIANISYSRLKTIIIHELNHIYIYRIPNYQTMPSWFKEGLAMYSAKEFSLLHKIEISNAQWTKKLFSLSQLNNFINYSADIIKLAYGQSAAAVESLEYYYGNSILNQILNFMQKNNDFNTALELSIKEKLQDFEIKYENYLRNNYTWLFLLRSPKYIYIILPIILTLGYIYHYYRNKKILKKWEIEEQLEDAKWLD